MKISLKIHPHWLRGKKKEKISGKKSLGRKRLGVKITAVVAVLGACVVFSQAILSLISLNEAYDSAVSAAQNGFDTEIQMEVQTVIAALTANNKREMSGEIDAKQEKAIATSIVRDSFYDHGNGYFWADTADGVCAVHYRPDLVGQNRMNEKDQNGTYYIRNLIAAGNKDGGGFTQFYYTKPGKGGVYLKRVYTEKFAPYGWYISTGAYEDEVDAITAPYQQAKLAAIIKMLAAGVLLLIAAVVVILRVSKTITRPLMQVADRLEKLAEGDLHTPVPDIRTGDETEMIARAADRTVRSQHEVIGDITRRLGAMAEGDFTSDSGCSYTGDNRPIGEAMEKISSALNASLLQIRSATDQVAAGAGQVAGGAQSLAQGTSEQASALEQLSVTVAKVSKDVNGSAESAAAASQLTAQAKRDAEKGRGRMSIMVEAMTEIEDSSDKIAKILKTIDSIAFQTNILALNASVEAARAGENGKGFTVVAEEVRRLAAKSADAAKTTTELVEESKHTVENGKNVLNSVEKSLSAIVESTKKSAGVVDSISAGAKTQAEALGGITDNVDQISRVIQTNSATAEQSAAASEELNSQASMMKNEVAKFRLASPAAKEPQEQGGEEE